MNHRFPRLVGATLMWGVAMSSFGGDFKKTYFDSTKPGAWSQYSTTTKDGSVSTYTYERKHDEDGRVVLSLAMKMTAGAGAGSESAYVYVMPVGFDLARDGLSFGKFTEKMSMNYGGMVMEVDEATLEVLRQSEKDYRGAVSFEDTETIDGRVCDRYAYALAGSGPAPTKETGWLWLDGAVPFSVVRQVGRVVNADGTVATEFEMNLQDVGQLQRAVEEPAPAAEVEIPPAPSVVSLAEGYRSGNVGIEVEAVAGKAGRELSLTLKNKTDAEITVNVPAGDTDLEADSPIHMLKITAREASSVALPAESSGDPLVVRQRGDHGTVEGKYNLYYYEGAPSFHGSVSLDKLPP